MYSNMSDGASSPVDEFSLLFRASELELFNGFPTASLCSHSQQSALAPRAMFPEIF